MEKQQNHGIRSVILLGTLATTACTTSPRQTELESEWAHLGTVGTLDCSPWPLRETELDVAYMTADATDTGGFVAGVRLRNGSRLPVFAETGGSVNLSRDDLTPLPVGRNAYVLAPVNWHKSPLAFVVQNKNDRAWLEVRSVADNGLVARMATPLPEESSSGRIMSSASGWWLQVNHSELDSSYVHVTVQGDSSWSFNALNFQSHTRNAALVGNSLQHSVYVVEGLQSVGDGSSSNFLITRLDPGGQHASLGKFSVPTKGGLESWSPVLIGSKLVLATIRGDSMVGQGVLTVSAYELATTAQLSWRRDFAFEDVHLGEPVWLSNGKKGFLGLMKWIDGEGALSRFKVDAGGAEQLSDAGVFARGSVLTGGFIGPKESGVGAFRYREKDLWKYKLCKLSL